MSIDTATEKAQLRTSFGLGSTDTVEFGGLIPPSGTTAEIDLITTATIGQVIIDTDRSLSVRFTGASTYEDIVGDIPTADIALNTAKVGITPTQTDAIVDNAAAIVTEAHIRANADTIGLGLINANTAAIAINTAKVGITTAQADAIVDNAAALDSLGVIDYPYTTDFQSGVEQTRNLTSITDLDGYKQNQNLTSIYFGSNVTSIGDQAFFVSQSLTSATIGNSVTSIGARAFLATALTSISIPNSVTSIGDGAFSSCNSLPSVIIPDSVTSLGSGAFAYCIGMTSIIFPDSITSIGDRMCTSCSVLTSFIIPDSVTSIGGQAFWDCTDLTSITIPNGVTSIGMGAFYGCTSLATINCLATTAPEYLGIMAFTSVAATDIHVPVGATGYSTTYGGLTVVADLTDLMIADLYE